MVTNKHSMNDERNDESGQFAPKYPDEAFLGALCEHDGAASTKQVAKQVECPRRTAYDRLEALHDAGRIEKRAVGAGVLWSFVEPDGQEDRDQ